MRISLFHFLLNRPGLHPKRHSSLSSVWKSTTHRDNNVETHNVSANFNTGYNSFASGNWMFYNTSNKVKQPKAKKGCPSVHARKARSTACLTPRILSVGSRYVWVVGFTPWPLCPRRESRWTCVAGGVTGLDAFEMRQSYSPGRE